MAVNTFSQDICLEKPQELLKNQEQVPQNNFLTPDPYQILFQGNLHPVFEDRVVKFVEEARAQGFDIMIFEGWRSWQRQSDLYGQKNTVTKAQEGMSFHNYGLAIDIVFRDPDGSASWAAEHPWQEIGKIGKSFGLKWGGDFKSIKDYSHFQLPVKESVSTLKKIYVKDGLNEVWRKVSVI
ncbi:MAG: M15 family metallopeptidase [Deltaproteobacteria bacterium]|nr:M15 family metallopeptidase [Deltaproteobacteria bacterium]